MHPLHWQCQTIIACYRTSSFFQFFLSSFLPFVSYFPLSSFYSLFFLLLSNVFKRIFYFLFPFPFHLLAQTERMSESKSVMGYLLRGWILHEFNLHLAIYTFPMSQQTLPSFLCVSTVLERTLAVSLTGGFFILFRHLVGLHSESDQPIAKTSTYTGQHNVEIRGQTSMP
jgi:hypothetical protein